MITATIAPAEHRYELVPDGETGVIVDRMLDGDLAEPRPVAQALAAMRVLEHAAVAERAAAALAQLTASATALAEAAAAAHEDLRAQWRDGAVVAAGYIAMEVTMHHHPPRSRAPAGRAPDRASTAVTS